MAAIVSNNFRVVNASNFKEDVANSAVYVGIGKGDVWSNTTSDTTDLATAPTPGDHLDEFGIARSNLQGVKKVSSANLSHVTNRHTWDGSTSYVAWDSKDSNIFDKKFYVVTNEFKVYKCIVAGSGASTQQPTQTLTQPQAESDGYTWKFMYTISVTDAEKFLTNAYMPVKYIPMGGEGQVLGGGSYKLLHLFGLPDLDPCCGFGLGFDRVLLALEAQAAAEGREEVVPGESRF